MIKNGKPYTNENGFIDSKLLSDRSSDEVYVICNWINNSILPRKTPLLEHTSYDLKHLLEKDTGVYLTNNEFKDAMLICGFAPIDADKLNWSYCISKKSPAFNSNKF